MRTLVLTALLFGCAVSHASVDEDVLGACSWMVDHCGGDMQQCETAMAHDLESHAGGIDHKSLRCVADMPATASCTELDVCLPRL